jgi:chromosome segregation protein
MLKALELSGFKSFADRTKFEFPRGISVIVGPNGSGKSNLVDAVKWVLGSQSAKSLRGHEMADVIFNGSATRGPMGTAEAVLTLDNAGRTLPIEAIDVHIARRVYRSGESEYLINRQPCRLRDIRELLAGTGIATEAYCIIEQGKVDALLQSSPRDRRVIFEEAAGISRFKAKKDAALRRMERVEQNLLRLSDIVDEVESRVRSIRTQAGKARRYRECATRLQELRTQAGLVDWRALTERIAARERHLAEIYHHQGQTEGSLAENESRLQQLEQAMEAGAEEQRRIEAAAFQAREQIAARLAALESRQLRQAELQQDIARCRRQVVALSSRADNSLQQLRDLASGCKAAEQEMTIAAAEARGQFDKLRGSQVELEQARANSEECRRIVSDAGRKATLLSNHLTSLRAGRLTLCADQQRLEKLLAESTASHERCQAELLEQVELEQRLASEADSCQTNLTTAEHALRRLRAELARADKQHRQLDAQLTRTRERINVLTELEERLEGIDRGVQEVLRMARDAPDGPLGGVCGVVADLFHVDIDSAPLIEVALGERAQFIVVTAGEPLLELLRREPLGVADRVGFLRLDVATPTSPLDRLDLSPEPGVMGRADRFVEAARQFVPLVQRLLRRTWLVDRLSTAVHLAEGAGRGLEFVTSDGELLMPDGTLVVGPRASVVGILSRRSELRACHEHMRELERQLAEHEVAHSGLEHDSSQQESVACAMRTRLNEFFRQLHEQRQQTAAVQVRAEQIVHEREHIQMQLSRAIEEVAKVDQNLEAAAAQQAAAQRETVRLEAECNAQLALFRTLEAQVASLQGIATEKQVVAARCEERVELLRYQMEQLTREQQDKDRVLAEARQRLAARESQNADHEADVLAGRQALAELYVLKEQHAAALADQAAADEARRRQRSEINAQVREVRNQLAVLHAQRHKLETAADRLRHERQTLCKRMHEDYGIDLAVAAGDKELCSGEHENRQAVEREIADLRAQIGQMGAVNMEALEELEEIETRFERLSSQHRDLVDAKASLERIVQRINVDSRQLFVATLETVRGHFQELFRRLFGGGEADIVLEDSEDVLESGIDVIARPPGKESCSISLLSGGEKTLTCVALLLAVFRSKPSPFCVLDEVDAALDEANIGRFVEVLRDFLSFTQFVVVTHSKKTMAGGDTLYGVTMEESGVSKRVAVRFEDVSEDGRILPAAHAERRRAA